MITIGVCDDDECCRNELLSYCRMYLTSVKEEGQFFAFSTLSSIINFSETQIDLLFLDIELGCHNAVDNMKNVIANKNIGKIVFVTTHLEAITKAFSTKTVGFEAKPINVQSIWRYVEEELQCKRENQLIVFPNGSMDIIRALDGVQYLKAEGNYTYLFDNDGRTLLNNNLKFYERQLNSASFIRVHRSYMVNLMHVKQVNNKSIMLDDGTCIQMGRAYGKIVKETYNEYIFAKAKFEMWG